VTVAVEKPGAMGPAAMPAACRCRCRGITEARQRMARTFRESRWPFPLRPDRRVARGCWSYAAGALLAARLPRHAAGRPPDRAGQRDRRPVPADRSERKRSANADLKGQWHLVFFGYTIAGRLPTALNEIALALDRLGAKRERSRSCSSPSIRARHARSAEILCRQFRCADHRADRRARRGGAGRQGLSVFYAKHPLPDGGYDMDHSAVIYVMKPRGPVHRHLHPGQHIRGDRERLQKLLS